MNITTAPEAATELTALFRARESVIAVPTVEEARVEKWIEVAAAAATMQVRFWDFSAGVTMLGGKPDRDYRGTEQQPDAVLEAIAGVEGSTDYPQRNVWVLRDFGVWLQPPVGAGTLRSLKNLARALSARPVHSAQVVILLGTGSLPPELATVKTVAWPLPDRAELAELLESTINTLPEADRQGNPIRAAAAAALANGARDRVIDAAVGLTAAEAQSTFAKSLVTTRTVDAAAVAGEKERALKGSGLEMLPPIDGGFAAVGGLDALKVWTGKRTNAYTPEARAYGLPAPKGILLVGVPGCGKTLVARALGGEQGVPVVKLDLGALKGKYVGESEASIRKAFSTLDAFGRCIVLVDEVEKALAGSTGPQGDGGVGADALGALLSWMNDRKSDAFVIATANDVSALPPELLRKGRFDQTFWVGLPERSERAAVIAAAVRARGRDVAALGIDVDAVADATDGFSGAEIDALVPESMFVAFADGAREITTADLLTSAASTRPASLSSTGKRVRPEFAIDAAAPSTAAQVPSGDAGRVLDMG